VIHVSLIDMTRFDEIKLDPGPNDHTLGRDLACDGVEGELASRASPRGEAAVALRSYGEGCVAVGIAGPVDRLMARRFGILLRDLRPFSTRELLLTLAQLGPWDSQLARVIGQARVQHLIDGGRLDLRDAPPEMFAAVGAPPSTSAEGHSIPAELDREPCLEEWGLRL
jgi:hypothetical protein